jgi:hypothetical protein
VTLSEEDKKQILSEHLHDVSRISDIEYQARVWIRGEGPECDDFDETVCRFMEPSDDILENYKEFGITNKQKEILEKFSIEFEKFSHQNYHPIQFITSTEWAEIINIAKEVLEAFHYKKRNELV